MRFLSFCAAGVACACTGAASAAPQPSPAHVYTDEDLARVRPLRDQTGVASVPAFTPSADAAPSDRRADSSRAADERRWRREAARHRARQAALSRRIEALERQIEARRRDRSRSRGPGAAAPLEDRLAALREQRREEDSAFEDRARRAGALPGWLREE